MKSLFRKAVFAATETMPVLAGCGKRIDYGLPETSTEFHTGSFVNPADSDDTYQSIEYNGRTYIGYGTSKGSIDGNDVVKCLGYIVQDGVIMKDLRVFLLNDDPDADYLVRFAIGGFMNQPVFFRALDTRGKKINTPPYIESQDYSYWK